MFGEGHIVQVRVSGVIIDDDKILLVKHRRRAREYWVLPGGKLGPHETVEDCLKREWREETGLEVAMDRLLYVADVMEPYGSQQSVNLVFLCHVVGGVIGSDNRRVSREMFDEAVFVPLAELDTLPFYPPLAGAIRASVAERFKDHAIYLGNLWTPMER